MGEHDVDTAGVVVAAEADAVTVAPSAHTDDSGHESITPNSQRSVTPAEGSAEKTGEEEEATSTIRLHLQLPTSEVIDVQVNVGEMAQELQQLLLERESTCHRTCFTLQFEGKPIDGFTELRNVENLKDGSTIKVVEEQYALRDVRIHLRHVRELCRSFDTTDAAVGRECASLSFVSTLNAYDDKKALGDKPSDFLPPSYLFPGAKERLLEPMIPTKDKDSSVNVVRNISVTSFNPPPGPRKMRGDVLYLAVDTMENRRFHITACNRGFFVNSSTDAVFKPTPSSQFKTVYHSLVDLISAISSTFKKNFPALLKRRIERHAFEKLPTPYQTYGWSVQNQDNADDFLRAEDYTHPHKIGMEDVVPGQIRDWNEEIQTTHELPRGEYPERLIRERAIFKIHTDFVAAAVKGAQQVIDGNVVPINPGDEPRTHMYIWNNIFFSLGFDVKDHYKELGGDAAAHVATSNDLQGVRAYDALDTEHLFTLGMVIVDYKGYRVTAQSIIPGILEREQEQSVVYGSIDFGKTIIGNEKYSELLAKTTEALRIEPHVVKSGKDDDKEVQLHSSFETKGIIGNDRRHYILDLLRTFPPDVNYLEKAEVTEKAAELGYPRKFPHKLAALRHELIDTFIESRYLNYLRHAAMLVNEIKGAKGQAVKAEEVVTAASDVKEAVSEIKKSDEAVEKSEQKLSEETKQIMREAAKEAGSMRDDEFEIRFNPDCYCDFVQHIPVLLEDCRQHQLNPIDGIGLTDAMHARGINVRYLGKIATDVKKDEEAGKDAEGKLDYLRRLCLMELFTRSAKHVFRPYVQDVSPSSFAAAVAHFLNCAFGAQPATNGRAEGPATSPEEATKKSKKGKKKSSSTSSTGTYVGGRKVCDSWNQFTARDFWRKLCADCDSYYGFSIEEDTSEAFFEKHELSKTALLRRFCIMVGIQLVVKDYNLDVSKARQPFSDEDIFNMVPVVKHVDKKSRDATNLFIAGQSRMQQGQFRGAYELIAESLNQMNSVYGSLHPDMGQCLRALARIAYILGEPQEAFVHQHKAVFTSERCLGLDHAQTISDYIQLAHFTFANMRIMASLRILYRARYLLLLAFGEQHPLMSQIDANIGVILFAMNEHDVAYKFLENARQLHDHFMGSKQNLKTAMIYHLLARVCSHRGDFRQALQMERVTYDVYDKSFGADNSRTKTSSNCLKHYLNQAVNLQKSIDGAAKRGQLNADLIPKPLPQLTIHEILEILNILNGIIFIQVPKNEASTSETKPSTEKTEEKPTDDVDLD
uniref:Clustered mitochondria protein homolog n=1 Tax=Steinernema glaseri TaxID=37863 RepID=A0A1I7YE19_9BILA